MTDQEVRPENPRTRRVRSLILSTAIEVLLTSGATEVTAQRVAEQADVARTTVYRHWPDQRSLLLATIAALTKPHEPAELAGPLADNLLLEIQKLRKRLEARQVRAVYGALAGHAAPDQAFAEALRLFVGQLVAPTVGVLAAAQARGELGSSVDCELEAHIVAAPILHQHLSLGGPIPDSLIAAVVERWLAAVAA